MNENDVKLVLALLEQDCHACKGRGYLGTKDIPPQPPHFDSTWHPCARCKETGKVLLLDPALVRKPCSAWPPHQGHRACQGRGWLPSNNEMDWVRALNKADYGVTFSPPRGTIDIWHPATAASGSSATIFEAAAQALGVVDEKVTP